MLPIEYQKSIQKSVNASLQVIKESVSRYPNQHAVMVFELVQGEGGFYPGHRDFFLPIMKYCRDHGIAVLVDEVQTFGRTSQLLATQHFELNEWVDVLTVGKLSQVCATLYKRHMQPNPGLVSQTFTSSSAAIEASIAILNELNTGDIMESKGRF